MPHNPLCALPIANGLTSADIGVSVQAYSAGLTHLGENSSGTVTATSVTLVLGSLSTTPLNATQLTSGTVPDARFPATLPALNGSALTALNASNLTSGTVAAARLPVNLTALANNSADVVTLTNVILTLGGVTVTSIGAETIYLGGAIYTSPQQITGSGSLGAINLTTLLTEIATVGASTGTLAAGSGSEWKRILMVTDGGDLVLTVASLYGGTTITFDAVGDYVELYCAGLTGLWHVINNNGCVIA